MRATAAELLVHVDVRSSEQLSSEKNAPRKSAMGKKDEQI